MTATDQFGEFGKLAPLLITLDRLRLHLAREDDLVWVLPDEVLPGVTVAYGIPVIRAKVQEPLLAHRNIEPKGGIDAP